MEHLCEYSPKWLNNNTFQRKKNKIDKVVEIFVKSRFDMFNQGHMSLVKLCTGSSSIRIISTAFLSNFTGYELIWPNDWNGYPDRETFWKEIKHGWMNAKIYHRTPDEKHFLKSKLLNHFEFSKLQVPFYCTDCVTCLMHCNFEKITT